jgi:hypothetical protein
MTFNPRLLFGTRATLQHPTLRNVRSNDKRSVTIFVENMYDHMKEHNVFSRAQHLTTGGTRELAESIDSIVGQAGNLGEKRCRQRRPEWYSIELVQMRLTVSLLGHFLKGLQQRQDRSAVILPYLYQQHRNSLHSTPLFSRQKPITVANAEKNTWKSFHRLQVTGSTNMRSPLRRGALLRLSKEATIRQILLDHIKIPDECPPPFTTMEKIGSLSDPRESKTWQTITIPEEIEYYLQLRNRLHFGQAAGTPFTTPDMKMILPWTGDSDTVDEVLSGTYVPPSTMEALCSKVLIHCKRVHDGDAISPVITMESFRGKIRKWRESTTTSPSGRHLGRYKALFAKGMHDPSDEEAIETFKAKQQAIVQVILSVMNFCIRTGHVLSRWKVVVNTMIFKDPGIFRIHRLRVLRIYEADLNLILAVKWRELLKRADVRGQVNVNQHGARPGCEASSLALCEELRSDVSYTTRRTIISIDNDASSCFDRMLPSLVTLNSQTYGLPRELATLHGATLKAMKYHLRTTMGISTTFYSHTKEYPIFGTGQGSGNSPVVWLLLSATLFDIHTSMAYGAEIQDPSGTHSVRVSISGFVDDTNACVNEWHPEHDGKLQDVMSKAMHDAQLWNDLLYVSGGKLELSKCSYHPLRFQFAADGTPSVVTTLPPGIRIIDLITCKRQYKSRHSTLFHHIGR